MRLLALFLAIFAGITAALALPHNLTLSRPGWAYTGAVLDYNFAGGQMWSSAQTHQSNITFGGPIPLFNVTRTSSGNFAQAMDGHWISFPASVARITDLGFLIEEPQTNTALWTREMSNAAWTKTNATAVTDAVGIDNLANNAVTVTANSANATVLQSITLASQLNVYSVFIKRVTGSGAIQTTVDGGTTWTTCAGINTTSFTRCSVNKTAANPSIGIRIVTSGDAVITDFSQCENNAVPTSPISTTTVAGTRAVDTIQSLTIPMVPFTYYWEGLVAGAAVVAIRNMVGPVSASASTQPRIFAASNSFQFSDNTHVQSTRATSTIAAIPNAQTYITGSATVPLLVGVTWDANGETVAANGSTTTTVGTMTAPTGTVQIGDTGSTRGINGYIQRITIWPNRLSDAQMAQLTTGK